MHFKLVVGLQYLAYVVTKLKKGKYGRDRLGYLPLETNKFYFDIFSIILKI